MNLLVKAISTVALGTTMLAAQAAPVLVFDNPNVVDTTDTPEAESDTIQASLTQTGNPVTTFTATTGAGVSAALAGQQVLVIPEQENAALTDVLDASALNAIRSFVSAGGGLIISSDYQSALNTLFGFNLQYDISNDPSTLTAGAAGTAFAGGPAVLAANQTTLGFLLNTLPADAVSIYNDANLSTVTLFHYGNGEIVQLGWDWNEAAPLGAMNGGWLDVLNRAVAQVSGGTVPPPSGVPEPGSIALLAVAGAALGAVRRRR